VLIVGGLLATFLLDRLLHRQATRLGGRWADTIIEGVSERASAVVADDLTARLAPVDDAREGLWSALQHVALTPAEEPGAAKRQM
jgi:hypothetical protein